MSESRPTRYMPHLMRIGQSWEETPDVRTLRLEFVEPHAAASVEWRPGQFGQFSVFGAGECVLTIANPPSRKGFILCTFRSMGKVTAALRSLAPGRIVGFRGPYGNHFPLEEWQGQDLLFVGGGIGMAALHAPLQFALDHRSDFGEILVLNGARTVGDLVYKEEMRGWEREQAVRVVRAVDPGGETPDWDGEVGLIPQVFERLHLAPDGKVVITCGPPIMIHFMLISLDNLGFGRERVVTSLENRMKCGIGQCGRCNIGRFFVCRDGPVVNAAHLQTLPADY